MKIAFSIFPKFFRELDVEELAGLVREAGLDTTNLVVRDGYWCEPATLARDAPRFVQAMEREGLVVRFATATYSPGDIRGDATPLEILADNGIREFRMSYFPMPHDDVREALRSARRQMEQVAETCLRIGIRAVYQIHHTMLIASPSAAFALVEGLPAEAVGIELDPGNQSFEGLEDWERSVSLLGEHLAAYGIKDTKLFRDAARLAEPHKGWSRDWCPLPEGVTNWHEVVRPLVRSAWSGTFVFMPFYHEDEPALQRQLLGQEVAYLREVLRQEMEAGAR